MSIHNPLNPVIELRVALTTGEYERLVKFYCDGLGLEPTASWNNDGGKALIPQEERVTGKLLDEEDMQERAEERAESGQPSDDSDDAGNRSSRRRRRRPGA